MQAPYLFDKIVNIQFRRTDGKTVNVQTPPTGRKPTIRISGKFVSQDILQSVELRLTNFVSDVPLSDYGTVSVPGYVSVQAGYAGRPLQAFQGTIQNAYQELPGPDGVTFFQMLIGNAGDWTTANYKAAYASGTPLRIVMGDLAGALSLTLQYNGQDLYLPVGVMFNCLAKDWFPKIRSLFSGYSIVIEPYGDKLVVFTEADGTGTVRSLDYIASANHVGTGFNIKAPWLPALIPGDRLKIDPRYFGQDIGSSAIPTGNEFQVIMVDFEFCTTDATNMMTVLTVGTGGGYA